MSRSRKGGGGGGGKLGRFAFAIFVLSAIVAVYQIPYDPGVKGIAAVAQSKAEHAGKWAESVGPKIVEEVGALLKGGRPAPTPGTGTPNSDKFEDGGDGSNPNGMTDKFDGIGDSNGGISFKEKFENLGGTTSTVIETAKSLPTGSADKIKYDRSEWKHWSTVRSCLDTRQAVLIRDAEPGSLVMTDKNGKETKDVNKGCKVVSGKWLDPYSGKTLDNPKDIDIDHVIALKYTATHGGQAWNAKEKEKYANDMDNPAHLLAVSAKENRTKSDKGPSEYLPPNKDFSCSYGKAWTSVAKNYKLKIDEKDRKVIIDLLGTC